MVSEIHLLALLRTIDRLIQEEGLDPALVPDDDKLDIAVQRIEMISVGFLVADTSFRESA